MPSSSPSARLISALSWIRAVAAGLIVLAGLGQPGLAVLAQYLQHPVAPVHRGPQCLVPRYPHAGARGEYRERIV
jgi:hypothetical protein